MDGDKTPYDPAMDTILRELAIARAAREAGLVVDGKLRDFTTASCNTTGAWEQSMLVSGDCAVVYFIVPRSAAEAAKGGGDGC